MKWYLKCFKHYADFSGRARRTEFWMFNLFYVIFLIVAIILDIVVAGGIGIVSSLYSLTLFLPSLAVTVRRLHDIGKSGWWYFINIIPLIGSIWFFVLLVTNSDVMNNKYGEYPKQY